MTVHAKIDPRLVVETLPVNAKSRTMKTVTKSCVPTPTAAQKSVGFLGCLNTSPLISFHPDCKEFGEHHIKSKESQECDPFASYMKS
jgi:hypothetical protein